MGGVRPTDIIDKTSIIIVIDPCSSAPQKIGQVVHAQLEVVLVNTAIIFRKHLASWRVTEQFGVKLADNLRDVLLNNQVGRLDGISLLRAKPDELRHIAKILPGIARAPFHLTFPWGVNAF